MKNRQGKTDKLIVFVVIAIAVIGLFYFFGGISKPKTLKEIGEPADISQEEQEKGMEITFYKKVDGEWVPVSTPDWFTAGALTEPFTIVEHPPAPTCTEATVAIDCPGYVVGGEIACWLGRCVLANVEGLDVTVRVYNSETYAIKDVYVSDLIAETKPTGLIIALPTGVVNKKQLLGGGQVSWKSAIMDFSALGWIGTDQTFSTKVYGTHPLTGATISSSSGDVMLRFSPDPLGQFSVVIETGVPKA